MLTVFMADLMTSIGNFWLKLFYLWLFHFRLAHFKFIFLIKHRRIFISFIILFVLLFFVQLFYKIIIVRSWIISIIIIYQYHLHNILYIKIIETFCVEFIFLDALENPLEIFFCDWLFLGFLTFLELKQLVSPFYYFSI